MLCTKRCRPLQVSSALPEILCQYRHGYSSAVRVFIQGIVTTITHTSLPLAWFYIDGDVVCFKCMAQLGEHEGRQRKLWRSSPGYIVVCGECAPETTRYDFCRYLTACGGGGVGREVGGTGGAELAGGAPAHELQRPQRRRRRRQRRRRQSRRRRRPKRRRRRQQRRRW